MRISPFGSTALTLVVCCVEPPALSFESEPPHAAARMPNNMTNESALRRIGFFPPEDEQRDDADAQRTRPAVSTAILSCRRNDRSQAPHRRPGTPGGERRALREVAGDRVPLPPVDQRRLL